MMEWVRDEMRAPRPSIESDLAESIMFLLVVVRAEDQRVKSLERLETWCRESKYNGYSDSARREAILSLLARFQNREAIQREAREG
jgi:hypothetical protein